MNQISAKTTTPEKYKHISKKKLTCKCILKKKHTYSLNTVAILSRMHLTTK